MSVYFAEGSQSTKTPELTCRHVLLKVNAITNDDYIFRAGAPRKRVQLLGNRAFQKLLDSIRLRIDRHEIMIKIHEAEMNWRVTMRTRSLRSGRS